MNGIPRLRAHAGVFFASDRACAAAGRRNRVVYSLPYVVGFCSYRFGTVPGVASALRPPMPSGS